MLVGGLASIDVIMRCYLRGTFVDLGYVGMLLNRIHAAGGLAA